MSLRKVLVLAVAFILVGTVSFGQKRTEKASFVFSDVGRWVGSCTGFDILTDYVGLLTWTNLFDKNGQLVKVNQKFRLIGDSIYYNSNDPNKSILGGPGEAENDLIKVSTGEYKTSGIIFKIKVPGHGLIFVETGELVWQCADPVYFDQCELVKNTGINLWMDGDVTALCDYLK